MVGRFAFWRLLATFGELRIEISTDMVAKIELKSMFLGRSAGLSGGILELKIDLVGHVGHPGCHLGGILVVFGCLGRILGACLAILPALGTISGGSVAILGGLGAVLSVSWTRHGADLGSPGTILKGFLAFRRR